MNTQKESNVKGTTLKKPVIRLHTQQTRSENEYAITIGKSPEEVFAFWRKLSNLPKFMKDLSSVEVLSPIRSKWTVKSKTGITADWIAEITDEVPGQLITWQSVEGEIKTEGSVRFSAAPAGMGTVVSLAMDYEVPGGKLAEIAALFTGENPETLILTNLKRLKAYLETGEIATTEGQPSGREEISQTQSRSLH